MEDINIPTEQPKSKKPNPKVVQLVSTCDLLEPISQQWFRAGQPVSVEKITGWMQSQIDANLLEVVD